MRLCVIGNSVAVYVRPRVAGAEPYPTRLAARLTATMGVPIELTVWAANSLTVADLLQRHGDELVALRPAHMIVNVGIVECTPRIWPQALRRQWVAATTRTQRLLLAAERALRRPLVHLTGGVPALSPVAFQHALTRLVNLAQDECRAAVYCLGIPPSNARLIREVPTIERQRRRFDAVIRSICVGHGCTYLDVSALVENDTALFIPDGVHFSDAGHEIVTEALAAALHRPPRESPSAGPAKQPSARPTPVPLIVALMLAPFALAWILLTRIGRRLTGVDR